MHMPQLLLVLLLRTIIHECIERTEGFDMIEQNPIENYAESIHVHTYILKMNGATIKTAQTTFNIIIISI